MNPSESNIQMDILRKPLSRLTDEQLDALAPALIYELSAGGIRSIGDLNENIVQEALKRLASP